MLAETLGAAVAELERRLQQTEAELQAARSEAESTQRAVGELREQRGVARRAGEEAQLRLAEQAPVLMEALSGLAALSDVPGLLMAAVNRDVSEAESVALAEAAGAVVDGSVPKAVLELARRLDDLAVERGADQNDVYSAHRELAAGDAADTEPRVLSMHGALAVLARDDVAEDPVVVLRARLEAAVIADQQLLTDREREYFEQHLLGDLGDALRQCQSEAQDLVAAMNGLLEEVRTSQGIRVRLDWRLRDDVPREAREAVELLAKPLGMLLPDEQARLRDALHALIETSRLDAPELGYGEHLARALDYRRWSQFRVRIHRPEGPADWSVLGRRTPLSQGEQKVVCYLPLFAAAAAHFTSVAGATPHAPRFILLDDAFPKIDVRTHPELFGLLVKLDLDFVVTSERLWGDHATVPSLAIYEALRSPTERGIAQYKHLWDGSRLQAVGL